MAQILVIIIYGIGLGMSIARHGKDKGTENAWVTLIAILSNFLILYWGGFWDSL